MNGSSLLLNIDEGADMKGNAFVFKRFNGFRMNHVGAIIAQFNRVYLGKSPNQSRLIKPFWVGIQHAGHVFPYGDRLCVPTRSKTGRRIVGSTPPQCGREMLRRSSDKALA